jgi:hypothetical protein
LGVKAVSVGPAGRTGLFPPLPEVGADSELGQ